MFFVSSIIMILFFIEVYSTHYNKNIRFENCEFDWFNNFPFNKLLISIFKFSYTQKSSYHILIFMQYISLYLIIEIK